MIQNSKFGYSEKEKELNWAAEYAKREIKKHREAVPIDHPDKSVTTEKIAAGAVIAEKIATDAVTTAKIASGAVNVNKIADGHVILKKLSSDIQSEIVKIPEFLCYAEPVHLTDFEKTYAGYEILPEIEINKFFKLENDTDRALTEFRGHDDYYTPLSSKILPGETRICILLKRASGGAEPQNGYLFVLDDTDTKSLINKEILERKNADNSLQKTITTLQNNINDEISERKNADTALEQRITSALFGDELMTHTVKFVAPENKPTLYWDGDQEYYGEFISLDVDLINSFYIDGKQISGEFHEYCLTIPCDSDAYVVIKYNFVENTCIIIASKSAVPSTISGNVWTFTLYRYYDIRLDFKMDSSSPTGDRYVFEGCNTDYIEPNEDTTGNTYTITNTYERLPTLDNFNTENRGSFLDAINEVEKRIDELEAAPWQISLGSEEPEGNNYIWFAPYVPQNSAQEVVLQTVDYNGDETKLHVDVDGETNTTDNTAVSDEDGTKVILFE